MLALVIVTTTALATRLAGIRELGSATFPGEDIAALRLGLLCGPAGLAVRLSGPTAIGWLLSVAEQWGGDHRVGRGRRGRVRPAGPGRELTCLVRS